MLHVLATSRTGENINMKKVIVVGATSAIAEATARLMAERGYSFYLVARKVERLSAIASDLYQRGATSVGYAPFDAEQICAASGILLDAARASMGGVDVILIAHGTLPDQAECIKDANRIFEAFQINVLSVMALATEAANHFSAAGSGSIVVLSSVAGDRGRQSNYVYGAAKGAVSIFLQGLRNRLHKSGVHVLTVKPGFVDTPMTKEFKKGFLWSNPVVIAQGIMRGIDGKKDEVYLPGFWRFVMFVICHVPERIFKRLSL